MGESYTNKPCPSGKFALSGRGGPTLDGTGICEGPTQNSYQSMKKILARVAALAAQHPDPDGTGRRRGTSRAADRGTRGSPGAASGGAAFRRRRLGWPPAARAARAGPAGGRHAERLAPGGCGGVTARREHRSDNQDGRRTARLGRGTGLQRARRPRSPETLPPIGTLLALLALGLVVRRRGRWTPSRAAHRLGVCGLHRGAALVAAVFAGGLGLRRAELRTPDEGEGATRAR